jgi:hypothetical protein
VAALARLVDALVLELAAELYLVAANKASDDRIKSDLAVAGSVAQSHGGNLRRAIVTCENVLRMPRLSTGHRLILEAWLCFLYEMIGSRIAMCKHGWRCVWLLCWHQQECRRALAKGWAKRSLEELSLIEGYTLGMQVIAYSLNRFGFKHPCLDSAIGRLARRVHDHSARYTEATGSLKDYADRQRELAHANMLAHDSTAALECANAAIEAYQWVGDSQNESNAHRTKGWVYLQWGRAKRTDSLAQRSFKDALSRKGVWFYSTRDGPRQD